MAWNKSSCARFQPQPGEIFRCAAFHRYPDQHVNLHEHRDRDRDCDSDEHCDAPANQYPNADR